MLTLDELNSLIQAGTIDTVLVQFSDMSGRFMGKRFDAEFFLNEVARHGTHACSYLLADDMEMEPVPGYKVANWERGYGDFHLIPDLATLRVASWLDRSALVICDVYDDGSGSLVDVAPRSILRRQIEEAASMGFSVMAASELEYYLFTNSYRDAHSRDYANLEPAGWYIEDYHMQQGARTEPFHAAVRRHLKASGIPIENSKGEWGLGQHELNVRYADVLSMADRHVVYKQCLKEVADQLGMSLTFMAKFAQSSAGSSSHLHLSLWIEERNAFHGDETLGPIACSATFRGFLGGWLHHLRELMVFFAPTVNSYKRYQSGSWAPTRIAWSRDNRTAGFRIVGNGSSLRIESRIPGADCNPYLAYAAALAAGLDGIRNRIEPPAAFEGDVYQARELPHVPHTLREATEHFRNSKFARQAFGSDVVEHYAHYFETEQVMFDDAVTDWERRRYFERI
jgi:glutamine synthetase